MYPGQAPMGYNTSWNTNTGYQAWPGQVGNMNPNMNAVSQAPQVNPQTGQPDYSAQWAEYYRSLGMHKEAEAIELQAKQQQQQVSNMNSQQGIFKK